MFWKKIKKKIQNAVRKATDFDKYISHYGGYDDCNIDAKTARNNYQAYQNDLNHRQQDLIKKWCKEIKEASSKGQKFIYTNQFIVDDDKNKICYLVCDGKARVFPQNASLQYFQHYFEERGFKVVRLDYQKNICGLKIIWIFDNDTEEI